MKVSKVIDYIVEWLINYCDNANMNGFVVGISGGIDSAVTSTLCAKSGKEVILLNLPIYQPEQQLSLAEQHIAWLEARFQNVKGVEVDLTAAFKSLEKTLPSGIQDGLSMANTRSRLRMLTLYAFATHNKMLVTGTGNKVEDFGVGFFTKYGDGGVDISPIADLMKTEIYDIGRELDITEGIINAAPTDGLWADDRTDESQLGATYAELEWAMQFEAEPQDEEQLNKRQKEILAIYRRLHQANVHKIKPVPVLNIPKSLR
jgi:NAD+ synthase